MNAYRITITLRRTVDKPIPAAALPRIEESTRRQIAELFPGDEIAGVQMREIKRPGPAPAKAPVKKIEKLRAQGHTIREIADILGVSKTAVHRILERQ